jgi:hypothetical protein
LPVVSEGHGIASCYDSFMKQIIKFVRRYPAGVAWASFALVAYVLLGRMAGLQPGDWGTWTGGVGTVGTLIGTIWMASHQSRRAAKAEMTLAQLHAVGLIVRLQVTAHLLDLACEQIEMITADNYNGNRLENAKAQLAGISIWPLEELLPLAPLPNFVAANLASARSRITSFPTLVENEMRRSHSQTQEGQLAGAETLLAEIRKTKDQVESARQGCLDAAQALNNQV